MMRGRIIKSHSGFFYVETAQRVIECRVRGKFRNQRIEPLPGDEVDVKEEQDGTGVVVTIYPRKNRFYRPPIANIDFMVIFLSEAIPVTDPFLADQMIATAEMNRCEPVLCINKIDIKSGGRLFDIYKDTGIPVVKTSARTGEGIGRLRELISGRVCVFTGNSGVGKSSILNALEPGLNAETGDVSEKLGRGKHTTRYIEFFHLSCGALVADTPGFSAFEAARLENVSMVQNGFREIARYHSDCRFRDCLHLTEPGCRVIEAVRQGEIQPSRYSSYAKLCEIEKARHKW